MAGGFARWTAATVALLLGVWISTHVWPHWQATSRESPVVAGEAAELPAPNVAPLPRLDERSALLGTDASISRPRLRLVLVSTSPARTLAESTAALGTDSRNPQIYAGGAVLANGARIDEVGPDHVVLSLGGRRTRLTTEREAPLAMAVASGTAAPETTVGGTLSTSREEREMGLSREDLSEFIRPQPVYEDARLSGLKIFAGANASALDRLGVQPGDIIRSIGGRPVASNADWQEIDDVLSSGGSITVGIERDGAILSVSMDGARLAGGQLTG